MVFNNRLHVVLTMRGFSEGNLPEYFPFVFSLRNCMELIQTLIWSYIKEVILRKSLIKSCLLRYMVQELTLIKKIIILMFDISTQQQIDEGDGEWTLLFMHYNWKRCLFCLIYIIASNCGYILTVIFHIRVSFFRLRPQLFYL